MTDEFFTFEYVDGQRELALMITDEDTGDFELIGQEQVHAQAETSGPQEQTGGILYLVRSYPGMTTKTEIVTWEGFPFDILDYEEQRYFLAALIRRFNQTRRLFLDPCDLEEFISDYLS